MSSVATPHGPCHDRPRGETRAQAPGGPLSGLASILAAASIFGSISGLGEDAARYGYWAVLLVVAGDGVFPVLPGETAIVAAAVLAANGDLNLPLVILAGAAGAVLGDSCAYWIGRGGGGPIRRFVVRVAGADRLSAAERMVERRGGALVFVGRFLPGIRIAINLSCGAGQMAYPRFLFFDVLGGIVWATQAALLGYFAGKAFADQIWVAFVVAFGVTLLVGGAITIQERKRVRREQAAVDAEAGGGETGSTPGAA